MAKSLRAWRRGVHGVCSFALSGQTARLASLAQLTARLSLVLCRSSRPTVGSFMFASASIARPPGAAAPAAAAADTADGSFAMQQHAVPHPLTLFETSTQPKASGLPAVEAAGAHAGLWSPGGLAMGALRTAAPARTLARLKIDRGTVEEKAWGIRELGLPSLPEGMLYLHSQRQQRTAQRGAGAVAHTLPNHDFALQRTCHVTDALAPASPTASLVPQ